MSADSNRLPRPGAVGLVAGSLVVLGVLAWMFGAKEFLFVAGLGAFGPGLLRELGWLRDQDEFQRETARRAGYHAYLVGGLVAIVVVSLLDLAGAAGEDATEWMRFVILVLWLTWLFSSLLSYWGAKKTAARVLMIFGTFWAVFAIATVISEWGTARSVGDNLAGVMATIGLVAPFFVLAWTAGRWPRVTGVILLAVSVAFAVFFFPSGNLRWSTVALTDAMLIVPMAASGIALLRTGAGELDAEPAI